MNFFARAQKGKQPSYFFTKASENYFTDAEIDSLLHDLSLIVFEENQVPARLFEKKYPVLKRELVQSLQKEVTASFKSIEARSLAKQAATKGMPAYDSIKLIYKDALLEKTRKAYTNTPGLRRYLSFSMSDRIVSFNSTVRVDTNGKLLVTEIITIFNGDGRPNPLYGNDPELQAAGSGNNEIKRGIVRTFPLSYVNRQKLFQNTSFRLKGITRDGQKEEYHTEKTAYGMVLYAGNEYAFLPNGYYKYTITYETDHQLKLLKDFDELYWNATGNGWSFRIDSAKCTIILPKGASPLSNRCYTGPQGVDKGNCNLISTTIGDSTFIVFKTTRALMSREGLTVASSWKKGLVKRPGSWQQLKYYIWNNKGVFFLPIAALFSALFGFICWLLYGRDPKRGTVYPLFEPPAGYSPAAMGYIYDQDFSRKLTAATIVDAAVRNKIRIDVEREGKIFKHNEYIIRKTDKGDKSGKKISITYGDFESDVKDLVGTTIEKGKYNSALGDLNTKVKEYCESNYKEESKKKRKGFFRLNSSYMILPGIVCFLLGLWALIDGVFRAMYLRNFWHIGYFILGIIFCSIVFKIFSKLLPLYTTEGRKMMDTIEGFRIFLSAADEKRFDTMNPPKRSLELYEKYLPFAIALGCEIEWGNRFEDIIETAYLSGGTASSSFSHSMSRDSNSFGSSFSSSFSGAISSASSPPSSSSGGGSSFGGGSSGGGGGGGGGGGW